MSTDLSQKIPHIYYHVQIATKRIKIKLACGDTKKNAPLFHPNNPTNNPRHHQMICKPTSSWNWLSKTKSSKTYYYNKAPK